MRLTLLLAASTASRAVVLLVELAAAFLLLGWGGLGAPGGESHCRLLLSALPRAPPPLGGLRDPATPPAPAPGGRPASSGARNSCFGGRRWLFLEFSCFYYFLSLSWSALTRS